MEPFDSELHNLNYRHLTNSVVLQVRNKRKGKLKMSCGTDIEKYLGENCKNRIIAVEYIGGDSCKKAVGILGSIAPNYIELVSNTDTCPYIGITVYTRNNPPMQECAKEMIIMIHNIISIETEPYFGYYFRRDSEVNADKNILNIPEVDVKDKYLLRENGENSKPLSDESIRNYVMEDNGYIEEPEDSWDEEE